MCDHHLHRPLQMVGEVDHVVLFSEHIGGLFLKSDYSDVTLIVEEQKFPAHKVLLAARSDYFRALLFGGMRESRADCTEIELKDTPAPAFKYLLKYVYTGRLNLKDMKVEMLLDMLGLCHQYGFAELETSISDFLKAALSIQNVCLIFDIANMYGLESLAQTCCEFIDRSANVIIQHESLLNLSPSALADIISRDSFYASEMQIFRAVQLWTQRNPNVDVKPVIANIRLTLMSPEDLLDSVRTSNLVSADAILDAMKARIQIRDSELSYRGYMTPEENVASPRLGAQVISGEMRNTLLDGENSNYDLDRGFTRHPIDDNNGQGITIQLTMPCIINTIRMLLWDKDMRSYSYYIEVSMDMKDWRKVIDYSHMLCRSWQHLRFAPRVVRYIRVVGTHNTVNRIFHLVSFECMFSRKPVKVENNIIVPADNVASIPASAAVIEGVSRCRNALINGDTKNYDWDSGYTCHQLGSGAIVVQLAQPFVIGSMRLLLWDCDQRSYSYYVDVSTDQHDWQLVCDRTREPCRSWQVIVFEPRPVAFIRIVGTHNTANEVFHCVHFECPAEPLTVSEYERQQARSVSSAEASGGSGLTAGGVAGTGREDALRGSPLSLRASPNLLAARADEQRDAAFLRAAQLDNHGDGYGLLPPARAWNNVEQDDVAADDEQR